MLAASKNENPDVIAMLANSGADLKAQDINGSSPLAAAENPNPTVMTSILPPISDTKGNKEAFVPTVTLEKAPNLYRSIEDARKPPTDDELCVVTSAQKLLGKPPDAKVTVNGRRFSLDCIGTVSAVFFDMGIDVTKDFNKYSGNGVDRLYKTLKDLKVLHRDKYPRIGDVIIWDNTWDAHHDGYRTYNPRTHTGLVVSVDDDGTIQYMHENLYKGVTVEVMNLLHPSVAWDANGKRLNSGLAIAAKKGGRKPRHWLSGDVFDTFGDVLNVKDYFSSTD
jgi:hypothetical protein